MKKIFKILEKIGVPVFYWTGNGEPILCTPFVNNKIYQFYWGLNWFYFKQMFYSDFRKRAGNLSQFVWFRHLKNNLLCFLFFPLIIISRKRNNYPIFNNLK